MKKRRYFFILLIFCIMAFHCLNAAAAENFQINITKKLVDGHLENQVSFVANFGVENAGKNAVVMVTDTAIGNRPATDEEVLYLYQEKTDASGKVQFDWTTTAGGNLLARVKLANNQEIAEKSFLLVSKEEYDKIFSDFNTAVDGNQTVDLIETYQAQVGFETKFFNELNTTAKVEVAEDFMKNKGSFTIENMKELFDKSLILTYITDQPDYAKTRELMNFYEDEILKLSTQENAKNIYKSYEDMDDLTKNLVIQSLSTCTYSEYAQVRERFNECVILTGWKHFDKEKLDVLFTQNADYVVLNGYSTLKTAEKNRILSELIKSTSIESINDLISAYNNIKNSSGNVIKDSGKVSSGGGTSIKTDVPIVNVAPLVEVKEEKFVDVPDEHWAKEAIYTLFKKGIINGKEDQKFCPEDNITREEFIKILVSAFDILDENAQCNLSDVGQSEWYYKYVASANNEGICLGHEDGTFGVGEYITREDMATILYRTLVQLRKMGFTKTASEKFKDFDEISDYAQNNVEMLYSAKIIKGMENNCFMPKNFAKRAEVAQLVYLLKIK